MSFEHMNGAVDAICNSLVNEPHKWVFETYTFYNKDSKNTEYWSDSGRNYPITSIWVGSIEDVFSESQGKRIREAYKIAREKQASESQKKIIASNETKKQPEIEKKSSAIKKPTIWLKELIQVILAVAFGIVVSLITLKPDIAHYLAFILTLICSIIYWLQDN